MVSCDDRTMQPLLFNDAPRVALRSVQSVSQLLVLDGFREVHRVGSFRSINGASYDGVPEMMLPGLLYICWIRVVGGIKRKGII